MKQEEQRIEVLGLKCKQSYGINVLKPYEKQNNLEYWVTQTISCRVREAGQKALHPWIMAKSHHNTALLETSLLLWLVLDPTTELLHGQGWI